MLRVCLAQAPSPGLGSLPVLRGNLAAHGVAADPRILQSSAVDTISPGPNGLYLIAIGYFRAGIGGAGAVGVWPRSPGDASVRPWQRTSW